jgi:hypothetical protein
MLEAFWAVLTVAGLVALAGWLTSPLRRQWDRELRPPERPLDLVGRRLR